MLAFLSPSGHQPLLLLWSGSVHHGTQICLCLCLQDIMELCNEWEPEPLFSAPDVGKETFQPPVLSA